MLKNDTRIINFSFRISKGNSAYFDNVTFYPMKGSMGNSDHKNFDCGIGVMAAHKGKGKLIKYYCGRIHTNKDVIYQEENIQFLTNGAIKLAQML